jgi:hypothetical protein
LGSARPRATPEQRRALLRELAADGGVILRDGRAHLDLRLVRAAGSAAADVSRAAVPPIALVQPPGCRTEHGAIGAVSMRLRLVA